MSRLPLQKTRHQGLPLCAANLVNIHFFSGKRYIFLEKSGFGFKKGASWGWAEGLYIGNDNPEWSKTMGKRSIDINKIMEDDEKIQSLHNDGVDDFTIAALLHCSQSDKLEKMAKRCIGVGKIERASGKTFNLKSKSFR
jgi:hypothetical protein